MAAGKRRRFPMELHLSQMIQGDDNNPHFCGGLIGFGNADRWLHFPVLRVVCGVELMRRAEPHAAKLDEGAALVPGKMLGKKISYLAAAGLNAAVSRTRISPSSADIDDVAHCIGLASSSPAVDLGEPRAHEWQVTIPSNHSGPALRLRQNSNPLRFGPASTPHTRPHYLFL
jgi:hypothetical protein